VSQPIIVIQARTGSTRFPNKINQLIGPKRMIDHVIDRARKTGLKWMLAHSKDYPQVAEEDVLGRFHAVLQSVDPEGDHYDPIIRLTSDTPMLDTGLLLTVLDAYRQGDDDLVGTGPEWDGLDVEVMSRRALARAHAAAVEEDEREHVTRWLKRYGKYREIPLEGPTLRWSVDDEEGLEFVRQVFECCPLCRTGVPHHTNAAGSIGGTNRHPIFDLHHLERGDLAECLAYELLMTRTGGPVYVSR
jgi:spore coat polysaccharide biosynthesis protein SpsF (cytidylyltransferase family)